jgi:hypothetical protein
MPKPSRKNPPEPEVMHTQATPAPLCQSLKNGSQLEMSHSRKVACSSPWVILDLLQETAIRAEQLHCIGVPASKQLGKLLFAGLFLHLACSPDILSPPLLRLERQLDSKHSHTHTHTHATITGLVAQGNLRLCKCIFAISLSKQCFFWRF